VRSIQINTLGTSSIADDPGREDINFSAAHVMPSVFCSPQQEKSNSILGKLQSLYSQHW
jgi:hypothetical protein